LKLFSAKYSKPDHLFNDKKSIGKLEIIKINKEHLTDVLVITVA
jgi:hypothetical protein